MACSVEEGREYAQGCGGRCILLTIDSGDYLLLFALEICFGKGCVQHHIGKQIERRIELRFQSREGNEGPVEIRRCVQLSTLSVIA